MRLPNKITSYNESVLPLFPVILSVVQKERKTPSEIVAICKGRSTSEVIEALDCLYALGKVSFNEEEGVIEYAF